MTSFIFPLIFILSSLGLFFGYISSAYDGIDVLKQKETSLDSALTQAKQLTALRDSLVARFNTLSSEQLSRLEKLLPDNVDNIRLIIDIDNMAKARGVKISDFGFAGGNNNNTGTGANSGADMSAGQARGVSPASEEQIPGVRGAPSLPYEAIALTFSARGSYEDFLAFLSDLEKSLRVVNIKSITLDSKDASTYDYEIIIETYWLK